MNSLMLNQPCDMPIEKLWLFLKKEFAPFPGRLQAVIRILLCIAIVITVSMTLQIPFLTLSIIIVFFTAKENTVLTRLSGMILLIGATISLVLSLLLIKLTINDPMFRILGACFIAFGGVYFMRASKLGAMGFVVALVVFYSQSFVDLYDNPYPVVKSILWVWVAVAYPITITIIINFVLFPPHPSKLLETEMHQQLNEIYIRLEAYGHQKIAPQIKFGMLEQKIQTLHRHLTLAGNSDPFIIKNKARYLMRITALNRLYAASIRLSQLPFDTLSPQQYRLIHQLRKSCSLIRLVIKSKKNFTSPYSFELDALGGSAQDSTLKEMVYAIEVFASADRLSQKDLPKIPQEEMAKPFKDTALHQIYMQFAFKTVLSATLCYVLYNSLQWPGIHTAVLTCFILAQPSLGAIVHKGITRIIGCALGSIVSLVCTVFITPHLEHITGLLLLTLPIVAIGTWVAVGSERTNYIGVQFVFAYVLALLSQFGPVTDLTEIRDRMLGIFIGVSVYLTISVFLWPEREAENLRHALAKLLNSISNLAHAKAPAVNQQWLQSMAILHQNRELQGRVALEPGLQYAHNSVTQRAVTLLSDTQELLFAVHWMHVVTTNNGIDSHTTVAPDIHRFNTRVSSILADASHSLTEYETFSHQETKESLKEALDQLELHCRELSNPLLVQTSIPHTLYQAAHKIYEHLIRVHDELVTINTTQQS